MARLLAVNVGLPREHAWRGRIVRTGVFKEPVVGRRMVRRLNIDGDGQGDLKGHGGEHRAVLVYQLDSYRHWQRELGRSEFAFGQFGENFTVDGLPDREVCVGDRFRIGDASFEVTQPRVTCYRVGIRMDEPRMAALLVAHGRPGFYLRVLEEGLVGAGDEIVKIFDGPERMTIAQINALLYLPGHRREDLERALRIPALSPGWRGSFRALLERPSDGGAVSGNAGLSAENAPPPAWQGFRALRVSRVDQESSTVFSLTLASLDGSPLATPLPGQFVVVRLQPDPAAAPLLRSYSLSGAPAADHYRISIKQEQHGAASGYLRNRIGVGDRLEVSAPRGTFTLRSDERPAVLLSAGVGVTAVLAMLHALVATGSKREVWWLYGARSAAEHPFARECEELLRQLPRSCRYVVYSQAPAGPPRGGGFDARGHLGVDVLTRLRVPAGADFYLCGPAAFLQDLTRGLLSLGVAPGRLHSEIFGPGLSSTPGISEQRRPAHAPAGPAGGGPRVSFARSGLSVNWDSRFQNLLELSEACDVPVRWSCRTGVCHSCEAALIGGSVTYRPNPLEPPATGNLLICCSRPQEDVVIDL
ncbi:MAG TPA: MOSC and FAD-binding oxidoreductase domain-containing protein [Steroidobacteraceae bacterium]|nr:MOSC and FAD-binding oxidoreductase domain-containing protein [Steroidobacteraceae bacterium]HUA23662.1 MOSC and FAD-binding oxidoreductase domain-containing protein [Steroidobacteraceae bacterium]